MKSESCSLRHTDTVAIRDDLHPPQHIVEEILDRLNKSIIFLNDDEMMMMAAAMAMATMVTMTTKKIQSNQKLIRIRMLPVVITG